MRPGSSLLADFYFCLGFFTRLTVSLGGIQERTAFARPFFARGPHATGGGRPRGTIAAIAMAVASGLGFPPPLAAPLAICSLVLLSGAMHEDGLADCADGFSGGATRERKLEIMRESQDRHVWRRGPRA